MNSKILILNGSASKSLFRTLGPLGLWSKPKKHEKKKESLGMSIINNKEIKKMVVVYDKNYVNFELCL